MSEGFHVTSLPGDSGEIKICCANAYASTWATYLLGDSLHPGGLTLTERLGRLLNLAPGQRVLDVASGQGSSALCLAEKFGCEVVGIDFSRESVTIAEARAADAGLSSLVHFEHGDAEQLPFAPAIFDAIVCECAFCTFPNKQTAASEFDRVLKAGGVLGLSDLTRNGPLPEELDGLLGWIACIGDAQPVATYIDILENAGIRTTLVEAQDALLTDTIREVRGKLVGLELLAKLQQIELPDVDFDQARVLARLASESVDAGKLGYTIVVGRKDE